MNRPLYRSGYVKNPEIQEKGGKAGNRSGQTGSETDWDEGEKGKKHLRRLLRTIPASRRSCRHEQPRTATTQ